MRLLRHRPRLEACGSIIVGKGHRDPGRSRAPLAADREYSTDIVPVED
jgi:hypothetical protein